jgi:hypothetical protein
MDEETRRLLDETHALAKDNHRMLRAIRRGQWMSFVSTVIIWVVILALPIYLYREYLEPIVSKFSIASGMSTTTASGFLHLPSFAGLQKLINSYTAGN